MTETLVGRGLMAAGLVLIVVGVARIVSSGDDPPAVVTAEAPPADSAPASTSGGASSSTAPSSTSTSTTTTTTSTTTTSTTTLVVVQAETPEDFLTVLVDAFAAGDAATLFARMNQATLDRYGSAQCEAYAATIAGMAQDLAFRSAAAAPTWDYTTDSVSTPIPDATAVEVARVLNGQTLIQEVHWQLVDGRFTWFTDCGDPV